MCLHTLRCIVSHLDLLAVSHLGVKTPGDPATPLPSTTHSCESSRAEKNSSPAKPGQRTQNCKKTKVFDNAFTANNDCELKGAHERTRFQRATTAATEAPTVHTSQHEQESRTKPTSGFQFPLHVENGERRPRAPMNCLRTCIHCRTKRCKEKYQLHL